MKKHSLIALAGLLAPTLVCADPPALSSTDLMPVIPSGQALNAAAMAKLATPTLPRRNTERRNRSGDRRTTSASVELLEVTPSCIVIANATIGHTGVVQQTAAVNTLNVNCN